MCSSNKARAGLQRGVSTHSGFIISVANCYYLVSHWLPNTYERDRSLTVDVKEELFHRIIPRHLLHGWLAVFVFMLPMLE